MEEARQIADMPRFEAAVWWGLAAGPFAWAWDQGTSYAMTQHACSTGHEYVLHVISIVGFLIAITGFMSAYKTHRALPKNADKQGHLPRDRAFFLSLLGMVMSLAFAVVVIANAVPRWILPPCS